MKDTGASFTDERKARLERHWKSMIALFDETLIRSGS